MAATPHEKKRLQRVFEGLVTVDQPNFEALIDEIYSDLETSYPTIAADERFIRAKLDIGESLQTQSVKLVDYEQSTQSEKLSSVFKNLTTLMTQWRADLKAITDLAAPNKNGARFGDFDAPHPPTWRDYPNA